MSKRCAMRSAISARQSTSRVGERQGGRLWTRPYDARGTRLTHCPSRRLPDPPPLPALVPNMASPMSLDKGVKIEYHPCPVTSAAFPGGARERGSIPGLWRQAGKISSPRWDHLTFPGRPQGTRWKIIDNCLTNCQLIALGRRSRSQAEPGNAAI